MRAFFFRRAWRERILLLATLLVGVGIWFSLFLGQVTEFRTRWVAASSTLATQAIWLRNAAEIEARLHSRLSQIKQSSSALNANQLVGQLSALAGKRFTMRLDPPVNESRPPVAIHKVTMVADRAELKPMAEFIDDLGTTLPLVNIEQMTITPDRRNPAQLNVRLQLSSLELLP
jgi:hypothetical protein